MIQTKKHKAKIGEFTAKSLEWKGQFDLYVYDKNGKEVYRSPILQYSLKGCSTAIQQELGFKGKRINWTSE